MKVKLGDVATYINGYAFKPTDWGDTGLQIIRIQDLTGNAYQVNKFNGDIDKKYEVDFGDVLISWSASLGVYVWKRKKAVLNQHIFKVVFDKCEVNKNFFVYQVQSILNSAVNEAHGATMKHLTKPVFDALPFYLPSISEQNSIADKLDLVSNLIEKRKQQLEKLDLLVKSKFIEMFGDPIINPNNWVVKGLMDIGECKNGINFGASETRESVKCISVGDIKNLSTIDNKSNISFVSLNELPTTEYLLRNEDIVFVRSNGNKNLVGRCVIVYPQGECMTFSGFCIRFRKNANIIQAQYLLYFFKQQSIRERITGRGANIQNLNQKILASLMIPIPPIELQNEFAAFVESTDKIKLKIKQSLEKFDILKKALMQKYFG